MPKFSDLVLGANVAWFGSATVYFTAGAAAFVQRHTVGETRLSTKLQAPIVYASRFLGGMNSALALLSLLCLRRRLQRRNKKTTNDDAADGERDLLTASALGHFSQWLFNVHPFVMWLAGREAELSIRFTRQMRLIFFLDALMAASNAAAALIE